ncbi:MAG: peptidylprolyl isomerase [Thermoanaerobaculia bacterium]
MKLLRDPLLHFVIAGAILFAGNELMNRSELNPSAIEYVHIGEGEIRWLKDTFANQWQRPPTEDELRGLVAAFLEEELFAREAKALGLDQNDTIVRRRLAQKLTFLVDDTSRIVEPTDEELRRFYHTNAERFRGQARITFSQLFFNPEKRQHAESDARAALVSISATGSDDAAAMGDSIPLENEFYEVDEQAVSNVFGADFARAIFLLKLGSWTGPVKSGYGVHLVRVIDLSPATLRPFGEVRQKILEEWRHQQEVEAKAAYLGKLREKYGVVIDDSVSRLLAPLPTEAQAP